MTYQVGSELVDLKAGDVGVVGKPKSVYGDVKIIFYAFIWWFWVTGGQNMTFG